jgi:hypothetical protein
MFLTANTRTILHTQCVRVNDLYVRELAPVEYLLATEPKATE